MKPSINKLGRLGCAFSMLALSTSAFSDLLGVQPGFPQMTSGGGSSFATIDQTADPSFYSQAEAIKLTLTPGGTSADAFGTKITILQLNIDTLCNAIGGAVGDDLSVSGQFWDLSIPAIIKDGVILTGEITEAGNLGSDDPLLFNATFDFRVDVTGGLLVTDGDWPTFSNGDLVPAAVILTVEGTSDSSGNPTAFNTNDCAAFMTTATAKGVIGPDDSAEPPTQEYDNPGVGTIGYWKTHPEAWPVETITIGGIDYDKATAIGWMQTPTNGDKTLSMFRQLVAAKLNVLIDNDPCDGGALIAAADDWMAAYPVNSGVSADSDAWSGTGQGDSMHDMLDAYNNGDLCVAHRE